MAHNDAPAWVKWAAVLRNELGEVKHVAWGRTSRSAENNADKWFAENAGIPLSQANRLMGGFGWTVELIERQPSQARDTAPATWE